MYVCVCVCLYLCMYVECVFVCLCVSVCVVRAYMRSDSLVRVLLSIGVLCVFVICDSYAY